MKIGLVFCALSLVASFALVGCGEESEKTGGDGAVGSPDEGPDVAEDQSDLTSARVTLRLPLLDYEGKPLSKHNPALTAAGLDTFPDTVEIEGRGTNGRALANADKKWNDAEKLVDKANEQLNLNIEMTLLAEPYNYKTSNPATSICYKGNPKLVVNLITSLTDNVFSDQLSIHGWRYRQMKVTELSEDDESFMPTVWRTWRGRGAAILFVTASSDGGEETNVGIIPKCQ
jgi:hypothetical protein